MNTLDLLHYVFCGPAFIILLLGTGIFFTFYLKFPQIRFIPKSIRLLLGKDKTSSSKSGDTSALQSLATSLGGSIGVGCIAGTGMAVNIGGPSSILWMFITSIIGMVLKYVEVVLCHKYRSKNLDGSISGTPMHFLKERLNFPKLAFVTAIFIILSAIIAGNMPQANSISKALYYLFGINKVSTGIVLSIVVGFIIIGGIKRIGLVAEKMIPLMSLIFLFISIVTIVYNYKNLIPSLKLIFLEPISGNAALGGFIGTTFSIAISKGVNKGLYTSDAGSGVSGIAHAASKEEDSFNEGVYSIIEPFLSTAIMCTLTGLIIITSGVWNKKFINEFDHSDIVILKGNYEQSNKNHLIKIKNHLISKEFLPVFDDILTVENGEIKNKDITIISTRSIAEDVSLFKDKRLYNGNIKINNGSIPKKHHNIKFIGKSLVAGVIPAMQAIKMTPLGNFGTFLLNICLTLFAITTVIAWYYYGDRGIVFIGAGKKIILVYKCVYISLFFIGAIIDTSFIWKISEICYAAMSIPNLLGVILLRKEIKKITSIGVKPK